MRVLLLANLRSGRGRAAALTTALERELAGRGHAIVVRDVCAGSGPPLPAHAGFADVDVVVSVGGDGTIHHALPDLIASKRPVYHAPGGNENLFAREFGMAPDPVVLARAIEGGRIEAVDAGVAGDRPFALMVSVGPDAGVIHRLSASRRRATGHAMYLGPVAGELLRPHLPRLSVVVDGRTVVEGRRGVVVVANSGRYALRLDPARGADVRDGLLDVVFLPASTSAGTLVRGVARALGLGSPGTRGALVTIESVEPAPWQTDGEVGGWLSPGEPLRLSPLPGALRVLCPPAP